MSKQKIIITIEDGVKDTLALSIVKEAISRYRWSAKDNNVKPYPCAMMFEGKQEADYGVIARKTKSEDTMSFVVFKRDKSVKL